MTTQYDRAIKCLADAADQVFALAVELIEEPKAPMEVGVLLLRTGNYLDDQVKRIPGGERYLYEKTRN